MSEKDPFRALTEFLAGVGNEAVPAGQNAAARVYLRVIRAAAPVMDAAKYFSGKSHRRPGQLRKSIKIVRGKVKSLFTYKGLKPIVRVFVGPDKKSGFYGYFVEKGHKTPVGRSQTFQTRRGRRFTTRRIKRTAGLPAHSQQGLTRNEQVSPRAWFEPAVRAAESDALEAAARAVNKKLSEINSRY